MRPVLLERAVFFRIFKFEYVRELNPPFIRIDRVIEQTILNDPCACEPMKSVVGFRGARVYQLPLDMWIPISFVMSSAKWALITCWDG